MTDPAPRAADRAPNRRDALVLLSVAAVTLSPYGAARAEEAGPPASGAGAGAVTDPNEKETPMAFELPPLPYAYDALQPFMSAETLEFHHDKHHQAYVTNGNNLLKGTEWEGKSLEEIVKGSYGKNAGLFNNAGQHYNHIHFWKWMKKDGGGTKLPGKLQAAIDSDLGGYEKFKADFVAAGTTQFGSGWAWLAVKDGKLAITKTPNGENPLVHGGTPILGVDVWEHSYYIDYRNARPKYLEAFVDSLINWDYVLEMYEKAV